MGLELELELFLGCGCVGVLRGRGVCVVAVDVQVLFQALDVLVVDDVVDAAERFVDQVQLVLEDAGDLADGLRGGAAALLWTPRRSVGDAFGLSHSRAVKEK